MTLKSELTAIYDYYRIELEYIREFIKSIEGFLSRRIKPRKSLKIGSKDVKQLIRFANVLKEAARSIEAGREFGRRKVTFNSKQLENFVVVIAKTVKHRSFLAEMALSYLFSYQESFIKDYLSEVFHHRPSILKSSQNVTTEEVLRFSSMSKFVSHLAEKEVERIGYGSIDDLANGFEKKFNISLSAFGEWKRVREAFFRRNLIIHNKGEINSAYRSKVPGGKRSGRLETTTEYVHEITDVVLGFMGFVHAAMIKKLGL